MHRVDSVNARPDQNGAGKDGFNDNTDISGMDATYQTPEWCNAIQEEIANVVEAAGIVLDKTQNDQLLAGIRNLFEAYTDAEIAALTTALDTALAGEAAIRADADTDEATARAGAISALLLKIGAVGSIDLQTQIDAIVVAVGGSIATDYAVLPGGFIIQKVTASADGSWPITFPNFYFTAVASFQTVAFASTNTHIGVNGTTSGFTLTFGADNGGPANIIAIGW